MTRVIGRDALLAEVRDLLGAGESVALCGPAGVGKSVLLDVIEKAALAGASAAVVRCTGVAEEAALPFTALRDLLAQCPESLFADLSEPVRAVIAAGLVGVPTSNGLRSDLAAAFHTLLEVWSAKQPVLLLLDDVQWLDAESATIVGYARRRLSGRVALVATVDSDREAGFGLGGLRHLDVAPLGVADLVDLLCSHGIAADVAQRVHVESGGVPALALALAGAIGERPIVLGERAALPLSLTRVLLDRFEAQPDDVRETLVQAALLHRASVSELERTGRLGAADDVRRAREVGLLARSGPALRFTPSALRGLVVESLPALERAERHRGLAALAPTDDARLRHLALSEPRPDAVLARELGAAAALAAGRGARELATELYVLAAERAPLQLVDERVEWWVAAVETGAPGNHVDLVQRALAGARDAQLSPAQAVRTRLAIPELAGHGVPLLDEVLTAALADAGDDDDLVAQVLVQRARIALMESRPTAACRSAERAVALLERVGTDNEVALALTTLAVARRWLGAPHADLLDRAVALAGPTPTGCLHISPHYMAARFAFYDDRLDEAWQAFVAMLGRVEQGAGMDHVHVLRCLVEVAARSGRCREVADYAARAARVGEEFDIDAHASWFIAAQAELLSGDLGLASTLAVRGAEAAEALGDVRYLQRHLIVLGQALLRSGDALGASEALARVRQIEREGGFGDPTVNRWHADQVSALVALARLDEAAEVLAEARYAVERRCGAGGVTAQLDRAEAELLVARGDLEGAELLLDRAAKVAVDLGLHLDVGRTLVARAHLERRRRRVAAGRAALREALDLFTGLHATTWAAQVRGELTPDRVPDGGEPLLDVLTDTEARIARAVAAGASNREIAERTYVSVKTVEATLTRIYRKLDVRSRTQLATLLVPNGLR